MRHWRNLFEEHCADQINLHATEADCISSITVPYSIIEKYPDLIYALSENPSKTMASGDEVLYNMIEDLNGSLRARIRVIGLPDSFEMLISDLRTRDRNRLLRIDVNVVDVNSNNGWVKEINWNCMECRGVNHTSQNFLQKREKPWRCCHCGKFRGRSTDFLLDSESTIYEDCQQIMIRDLHIGAGNKVRHISAWIFDELVESINNGDNIRINARLRLASTHSSGDFDATTLRYFELQIESFERLMPLGDIVESPLREDEPTPEQTDEPTDVDKKATQTVDGITEEE